MSTAFMPVCSPGVTAIRVSTTGEASLPAMTMATACAKCTSTRWKAFGLSCGVGYARIGGFPKRNSQSTWASLSSCTMSASEAKRCCLRSLSSWSRKTLESNKSDLGNGLHHLLQRRLLESQNLLLRQPVLPPGHLLQEQAQGAGTCAGLPPIQVQGCLKT